MYPKLYLHNVQPFKESFVKINKQHNMARPKRVYPNALPNYNLLHSRKVRMYSGIQITALHQCKETEHYYISVEAWSFCCTTFKSKKKYTKLSVDLPTLTDEKAIAFLNEHAWDDWVAREVRDNDSDMLESLTLLERIFPDKKPIYFYELDSIVSAFCNGSFVSYDKEGNVLPMNENKIKSRKYYTHKYNKHAGMKVPHIKALYETYNKLRKEGKEKDKAFSAYYDAEREYVYENFDQTEIFKTLGEHTIVCPSAFNKALMEGSSYEHAGELYLVLTKDNVYFEIKRHI